MCCGFGSHKWLWRAELSEVQSSDVMPCSSSVLSSGAVTAVATAQGRSEKKP